MRANIHSLLIILYVPKAKASDVYFKLDKAMNANT